MLQHLPPVTDQMEPYRVESLEGPMNSQTITPEDKQVPASASTRPIIKFNIQVAPIEYGFMGYPSDFTALASEEALGKIWNDPSEDEAWADL